MGTQFDAKYERLKLLGQGTYGTAHLVRSRQGNDALFVAKEIRISHLPEKEQKVALSEAEVLRDLNYHSNIIAFVSSFREGPSLYIVMEYADGGDLAAKILARKDANRPFSESEVMFVFLQLILALMHIHAKRILHRDLKPMNIFLTKAGIIKLGDFGIAKVLESTTSGAMTLIGTPLYLSPEVCHNEPYGVASDLWSLGVVAYEVTALHPPFKAASLPALVSKVCNAEPEPLPVHPYSSELRRTVMSLLAKDPRSRPELCAVIRTPFASGYMKDLLAHSLATGGGGCEHMTDRPPPAPAPKRSSSQPPVAVPMTAAVVADASPSDSDVSPSKAAQRGPAGQRSRRGGDDVSSQMPAIDKQEVVSQFLQNRQIAMQAKLRARGCSNEMQLFGANPAARAPVPAPAPAPAEVTAVPATRAPASRLQEAAAQIDDATRVRAPIAAPAGAARGAAGQRPARSQSAHAAPQSAGNSSESLPENDGLSRAALVRLKKQQEREEQERQQKQRLQQAMEEARADRRLAQQRQAEQQQGVLTQSRRPPQSSGLQQELATQHSPAPTAPSTAHIDDIGEATLVPGSANTPPLPVATEHVAPSTPETTLRPPGARPNLLAAQPLASVDEVATLRLQPSEGEPDMTSIQSKSCDVEQLQDILAAAVCYADAAEAVAVAGASEATAEQDNLELSSTFLSAVVGENITAAAVAVAAKQMTPGVVANEAPALPSQVCEDVGPVALQDKVHLSGSPPKAAAGSPPKPAAAGSPPKSVLSSEAPTNNGKASPGSKYVVDSPPAARAEAAVTEEADPTSAQQPLPQAKAPPLPQAVATSQDPEVSRPRPQPDGKPNVIPAAKEEPAAAPPAASTKEPGGSKHLPLKEDQALAAAATAASPGQVDVANAGEATPMTSDSKSKAKGRCCVVM